MIRVFITVFILAASIVFFIPSCKEKDTTPPVITILGANPLNHQLGVPYEDPGATALDEEDGDLSSEIEATVNVNVDVEGYNYSVEYKVKDKAGNEATPAIRSVHVLVF
jgi:hypothetical protein